MTTLVKLRIRRCDFVLCRKEYEYRRSTSRYCSQDCRIADNLVGDKIKALIADYEAKLRQAGSDDKPVYEEYDWGA